MGKEKKSPQLHPARTEEPVLSSRCPKCGHVSGRATSECGKCGVIYSRYVAIKQKKQKEAEERKKSGASAEAQEKSGGRFSWLQMLVVVLITFGLTFYYFTNRKNNELPVAVTVDEREPSVDSKIGVKKAPQLPEIAQNNQTAYQAAPTTQDVGDAIAHARQATVSIVTPIGTGSGFFVNSSYIVTNKHVVQPDEKEIQRLRKEIEPRKEILKLEKERLLDLKKKLKSNISSKAKKEIRIIIKKRQEQLDEYEKNLNTWIERLESMERFIDPADIKIVLEDGSKHSCRYLKVSRDNDLAVLATDIYDAVFLKKPDKEFQLRQGDKVYTVGSPVGLRNTVTSGVFSGYRINNETGKKYLQTDAPINPGNSGGPLIDENGEVHGINTMILLNTEGIGFAIPISKVYDEFSDVLVE